MKIALLTVDLLGEKSYSINYHLLLSLRALIRYSPDDEYLILTTSINSEIEKAFIQVCHDLGVTLPSGHVQLLSVDHTKNYRTIEILCQQDAIYTEMYVWADAIKKVKVLKPALKVVYWIHSLLQEEHICNRHSQWIKFDLFVSQQEQLLELSDHLIFDSNYDMQLCNRFYCTKEKSHVVYPVPHLRKFSPRRVTGNTIVYPGRWEYRKGLEHLIRAFFKLYSEDNNYRLILMSDSNGISNYEDVFVNSTVLRMFKCMLEQNAIVMEHWRNSREEYMRVLSDMASVVVIPSLYDPFNIVAYDSIAQNIPVIISNFCGVTEIITEEMCVERINPYNPESMAIRIKHFLNKVQSKEILNAPFHYTIKNADKALIEIHKKLINKSDI